jgi:hypothetical protein
MILFTELEKKVEETDDGKYFCRRQNGHIFSGKDFSNIDFASMGSMVMECTGKFPRR